MLEEPPGPPYKSASLEPGEGRREPPGCGPGGGGGGKDKCAAATAAAAAAAGLVAAKRGEEENKECKLELFP